MPQLVEPELKTYLPDIDQVSPISEQDENCFEEIRQVLVKHGALNRFGISLLHQHFPMSDDEVLVERIDVENRVLITRPEKRSASDLATETSWSLGPTRAARRCETQCRQDRDNDGNAVHLSVHYTTS
jgi:hypothetical protein